jgi:DNA polymerase V
MENPLSIPLFEENVAAGFPSPAEGHVDSRLNIQELLVKHPAATFFVKVEGDSMKDAHIQTGDILVVDRALTPVSGKIVMARIVSEFTVKRLVIREDQFFLVPENPAYQEVDITGRDDVEIWGVVTYVIHKA